MGGRCADVRKMCRYADVQICRCEEDVQMCKYADVQMNRVVANR
jgi:hypothetical protein